MHRVGIFREQRAEMNISVVRLVKEEIISKIAVFLDMTSCRLVGRYQRKGGA
jgi:hypothetical protein